MVVELSAGLVVGKENAVTISVSDHSGAGISAALERDGYVLLKRWVRNSGFAELLQAHGRPLSFSRQSPVHRVVPKDVDTPNTYSGLHGLGAFPLHTDMAHWPEPPRYMVLRCLKGYDNVVTPIVDGCDLVDREGGGDLSRALVKPRRPVRGRIPLLNLFRAARSDLAMRLRWDQRFIVPASAAGAAGMDRIRATLASVPIRNVQLSEPGDTLWLDNWRMLHGRSAVPADCSDRIIERAYLGEVF